ncbi:hypothetical protein RIF29_13271 [Crotalaria pallida]|uniref:C2 domain-containing protein n=1 Tax=Crotalaria pallida TaxID=3830 RepID=A0AAN9IP24_CROPI
MGSRHEVEVKIASARDLKNVNWRHGKNKPYAVVWVDPKNKFSTNVDESGDTEAKWDQTLLIQLPVGPIEDNSLYVDIVHAGSEEDTKPLIGSARLQLADVIADGGIGQLASRTLTLKRSSGRPQGKIDVKVTIKDKSYPAPGGYYAPPPYGVAPPAMQPRDYGYPYGGGYAAPPSSGYPYAAAPPAGYPVGGGYGAPLPTTSYGQGGYGYAAAPPAAAPAAASVTVATVAPPVEEKKKSKFGGMGTGLAVGALAGAVGGFALMEGAEHLKDKISDDAAKKVEEDLAYDSDDDY